MRFGGHPVAPLKPAEHYLQVQVTHASDHQLGALLFPLKGEGGITLGELLEPHADLLLVLPAAWLDRQRHHRPGQLDRWKSQHPRLAAQHVIEPNVLHLGSADDVARNRLTHLLLLRTEHLVDMADPLRLAGPTHAHHRARRQRATEEAEENKPANVHVHDALEDLRAERPLGIGLQFCATQQRIGTILPWAIACLKVASIFSPSISSPSR